MDKNPIRGGVWWGEIIPDNASSMVSRADPLSPTIVEAFADYAAKNYGARG